MSRAVFRFAPSPNGELHLGHAFSALLNETAARAAGGRFLVRLEDIDTLRCSRALAKQMLDDLAWLGLRWEAPVRVQSAHLGDYRAVQARLAAMGLVYPCFCTRAELARAETARDPDGQKVYPGTCRGLDPVLRAERIGHGEAFALRLDVGLAAARLDGPLSWREAGEGRVRAEPERWGDVVLGRKDIGTSYHIAVVVDDALQNVTTIMRGRDLYHATAIHRLLQHLLGLPEPEYAHHRLIGDEAGRKLAKSAKDKSLRALRAEGVTAQEVREILGFDHKLPAAVSTP